MDADDDAPHSSDLIPMHHLGQLMGSRVVGYLPGQASLLIPPTFCIMPANRFSQYTSKDNGTIGGVSSPQPR